MSKVSRESAPEVVDYGPAEDRTAHFHGYTVNFTSIREDSDLDHEEVIEPGDAFYMPPGHVPAAKAGSEFVIFSPSAGLEVSEAAMRANMERLMQGS
jgi:ribosomal protein L16 Arg81 hydroxylase